MYFKYVMISGHFSFSNSLECRNNCIFKQFNICVCIFVCMRDYVHKYCKTNN